MSEEYDTGYFEGVRNSWMALVSNGHDIEAFIEWISKELAQARQLRDEWEE